MDDISISALKLGLDLTEDSDKKFEFKYEEPKTFATEEAEKLQPVKERKMNFELVNPFTALNSGAGSQSFTSYNWQPIAYPQCAIIAQNPLMKAVLNV